MVEKFYEKDAIQSCFKPNLAPMKAVRFEVIFALEARTGFENKWTIFSNIAHLFLRASRGKEFESDPFIGAKLGFNHQMEFRKKSNSKKEKWQIKEWFVLIHHEQKGPYNLFDLQRNPHFTPDTLVWRKGFQEWIKARFVPELKEVFKDSQTSGIDSDWEDEEGIKGKRGQSDLAVLTLQQDPYQFVLWIILILLILFYSVYQYYHG